jgi:PAS domain S-box-containing protein
MQQVLAIGFAEDAAQKIMEISSHESWGVDIRTFETATDAIGYPWPERNTLALVNWQTESSICMRFISSAAFALNFAFRIAVVQAFEPELLLELAQMGFDRVIPWQRMGDLLPVVIRQLAQSGLHDERLAATPTRRLEDRFAKIFQTSPIGIGVLRVSTGCFLEANESLLNLLETSKEEIKQKTLADFAFNPILSHRDVLDTVVQLGGLHNSDERLVTTSHRSLRVLVSFELIEFGEELTLVVFVQDLTGRTQVEEKIRRLNSDLEKSMLERTGALEALNRELAAEVGFRKAIEESSLRLNQILWETPDMVAIGEMGGRFQYLNKSCRMMLGLDEAAPVSHLSVYDVYPEDLRDYVRQQVVPTVFRNGMWQGEIEFLLRGQRIPVVQMLLAHRNQDGKVGFFSSVAREITIEKKAAQELEKALKHEKELGILRASFFAMTSHQFRTPISAILTSAELLEHYGSQWAHDKRLLHLHRIQGEAQRLSHLLDNILAISRMESSSEEVTSEMIDLVPLVESCIAHLEVADGGEHSFEFTTNHLSICMRTSSATLEHILDNLLSNAAKFSQAGEEVQVTLSLRSEDVVVRIEDHGIGIPEEDLSLIFQPFFRASNVEDVAGSGLGLMVVEKSLQLIGGEIDIQSQTGVGTIVEVRLPLNKGKGK